MFNSETEAVNKMNYATYNNKEKINHKDITVMNS